MTVLEALGAGWALGLAGATALAFTLHLLGVPASLFLPMVPVVTLLGLVGGVRCAMRRTSARSLLGAGVCAVPILLLAPRLVRLALAAPLARWDSWAIWGYKARLVLADGPTLRYFNDALTAYSHPDYPLNVPIAEAAAIRLGGTSAATLLGPACLIALLLLYAGGVTRLYGGIAAAVVTVLLACIPAFSLLAVRGDADMPLALYAGGGALYLALWWRHRRAADALLFALFAGAAIWTKKEGLPLAGIYLVAFAAQEVRRPAEQRLFAPLLAALLLPLPWLLFTAIVRPTATDFLPYTPSVLVSHLDRVPTILRYLAGQAVTWDWWGVLWVLVAGAALLRRGSPLIPLLVLQLAAVAVPYIFSSWDPYTEHIKLSLDRLLAHLEPLAVLALVDILQRVPPRFRLGVLKVESGAEETSSC